MRSQRPWLEWCVEEEETEWGPARGREERQMRAKLKVVKADGAVEGYVHTKVIGTISLALECAGRPDIYVAEERAIGVTYYI